MPPPKRELSHAERVDWLRLQRTPRVGPVTFAQLIARFGDARTALEALPDLARRAGGQLKPASRADVERELDAVMRYGARLVCLCEPDYPPLLAGIDDPPPSIGVAGHVHLLRTDGVAVVGARNASLNARRMAHHWAERLAGEGLCVISGLARGIDAAAHEGALAAGGFTVAVVAGGLDVLFPEENRRIFEQMRERGAIVAESPLGTHPTARHFPKRNRIIAGMARATLVVEAARRSGSLITARLANEYGREVMAVPGSPLDPRAQGTNALIKQGASLVQSADEVIEILNDLPPPEVAMPDPDRFASAPVDPSAWELEQARSALIECLSPTATPVDELIRASQLSAPLVQMVLVELELAGKVERQPGNRVALIDFI